MSASRLALSCLLMRHHQQTLPMPACPQELGGIHMGHWVSLRHSTHVIQKITFAGAGEAYKD